MSATSEKYKGNEGKYAQKTERLKGKGDNFFSYEQPHALLRFTR